VGYGKLVEKLSSMSANLRSMKKNEKIEFLNPRMNILINMNVHFSFRQILPHMEFIWNLLRLFERALLSNFKKYIIMDRV